jgi:hypothetical protein
MKIEKIEVRKNIEAAIEVAGERTDISATALYKPQKLKVKNVNIFSWGADNKLVNTMIALSLSNSDVLNLLNTAKDFYYGTGLKLFEQVDSDIKPISNAIIRQKMLEYGLNDWVKKTIASVVDTGWSPCNVSYNRRFSIRSLDPTTARAGYIEKTEKGISQYYISANWENTSADVIPVSIFNSLKPVPESIYIIKEAQSGMPVYGWPTWWSAKEWIELANRIPKFYNDSLDTEGNLGHVVRVAKKLLEEVQNEAGINPSTDEPYTFTEIKKQFYASCEEFLFGTGKQKRLFDVCGVDMNNKMEKWVEFEAIPKSFTGKEYMELYNACLVAIAACVGILSGLSSVSDGKMNSGGGSEIRISAEYQQFYRTERVRSSICDFLNMVILPQFLGDCNLTDPNRDIFFGFGNVVLQTLDKNPTGSKNVVNAA